MGTLIRGAKNAFRNTIRTVSVTVILAISIGLALIMMLSYKTVEARIVTVKSTIGNTITVSPAGARGFEGGGEPLTETQIATIQSLDHITTIDETLADRLTPGTDTTLTSAIDPGTLGTRFRSRGGSDEVAPPVVGSSGQTGSFVLPITVTGLSDPSTVQKDSSKLTSGTLFSADSNENVALIGTALATKNNLTVGSTFTAYGTTITVKGITDAGNEFDNSGMYMPLKTLQRLSGQDGQISSATVQVDSVTNIDATASNIKDTLGADKADVTSNADAAKQALSPLENIQTISLYSLFGALAAGAVITFLIMMMIVRERRREIGVLKAIGSSNLGIVTQFIAESLVLTAMGAAVGIVLGISFSNPVLNALVSNSEPAVATGGPGLVRGAGRIAQFGGQIGGGVQNAFRDLHNTIGIEVILYGLLAAVGIAIIGSAIPAWLIAKIKPAEVMRGE